MRVSARRWRGSGMGGDVRQISLDEAADLLTGYPFKSDQFSDGPQGLRLLRGDNVIQGQTRWSGAKHWPQHVTKAVEPYLLRPGDVVLAMDRPWIAAGLKHATLTQSDCPCLLVQRVARLRARPEIDQRFLGYVISSADFTNFVLGVQTGTAVPHISGGQIKSFKFGLPPLRTQRQAAEVLGALDDKIELNRRIAGALEAMVRALFRSWFVDFDPVRAKAEGRSTGLPEILATHFPDVIGGEGIPQGWSTCSLNEMAELDRSTCDPSTLGEEAVDHFSIPAFDATRSPARDLASTIKSLKLRVVAPVVLFSKLNPETPRVWPVLSQSVDPMLASTEFLALRPQPDRVSLAFLVSLLTSAAFRARASGMVTGTSKSHQRVQPGALMQLKCLMPPPAILQAFDEVAAPMMLRIDGLLQQSNTLAALRNTLLPKLISGELRIEDAAAEVSAA